MVNIIEVLMFYLKLLTIENTDTINITQRPEGSIIVGTSVQFECFGSNPLLPLVGVQWILQKRGGRSESVLGTDGGMVEIVFNDSDTTNILCKVGSGNKNGSLSLEFRTVIDTNLPFVPIGFKVVEVTSRTIQFAWGFPQANSPRIKQYVIEYKKAKGSWVTGKERVIVAGISAKAIVNNLKPWTSFHFRIFAENEVGNSTPTTSLTVITAEDLPYGTPMNVEASIIDETTLQVCWTPPPKEEWNGALLGFNVGYRKYPSSEDDLYTFQIVVFPKTVGKYYGLNITVPDTSNEYGVVVQAFNNVGAGPLSAEVTQFTPKRTNYEFMQITEDETPPPPPAISVVKTADTTVVIHFKLPNGDYSSVQGFKLHYKEDYESDWTIVNVKPTKFAETLYEIEGLNCGFRYTIYAISYDSKEDSPPSDVLNVRTKGPRPGFCTDDRER